jgi:hypothetical protein
MSTPESMSEAATARKHRIAMRRNRQRSSSASTSSSATISSFADNEEEIKTSVKNSKRLLSALQEDDVVEEDTPIFVSSSTSNCEEVVAEEDDVQQTPPKKQKPHITGIKKQSRYDPGVTLNKEELKAWRKEARRVRNRESAAASRKKNRESIESLQTKVDDIKAKYTAALQYILGLEGDFEPQQQQTTSTPFTTLRQDLEEIKKSLPSSSPGTFSVSRPCSPVREVMLISVQTVSPPTSPIPQDEEVQQEKIQRRHPSKVQIINNQDKNTSNNHPLSDHDHHYDHHPTSTNSQSQHIIDNMISRPIACV